MNSTNPKILVLMSIYNGEKYLLEQLESLKAQEGVELHLLVRDDGSSDNTISILKRFKNQFKNLTIIKEGNIGVARSFMRLMEVAATLDNEFDYYAFCDQDDIWLSNKLQVAIQHLDSLDRSLPTLYISKPQLVDKDLNYLNTNWINLNCTFGESMIVNGALGCTEVLNRKLLELINLYKPDFLLMHDGWVYRVCLAMGGKVYYDRNSYILYRQHANNVIGGKTNFYLKWKRRINAYIKNQKNVRSKTARDLLNGYKEYILKENKILLEQIVRYRSSIKARIKLLFNRNLKSNSVEHNLIFKIAVILGIY